MKLAELIPHTSKWLGIPETHVTSVVRELRPAGLVSSMGRGPRGADMTVDDKVNLLLGVCGVEVANRAAEYVKVWRRSACAHRTTHPTDFAFLRADNVKDLIVDLITKDLDGGPLDAWLKEADKALADKISGDPVGSIRTLVFAEPPSDEFSLDLTGGIKNHTVTLDFFVDEFSLELIVSRNTVPVQTKLKRVLSDAIAVRFAPPPPPLDISIPPRLSQSYAAPSHLIRRLDEKNLIGWGQCLRGEA